MFGDYDWCDERRLTHRSETGKKYLPTLFQWALAAIVLGLPPIYLARYPESYTPIVEVLLNVLLFLLAYWIGHNQEAAQAARRANDRWLPQAESVISRLLTLHANVISFGLATKVNCQLSEGELPELKQDNLRAVRIKMKTECEASSHRLSDIAHQLEDAIADWERFVVANCADDECYRIFRYINERKRVLVKELTQTQPSGEAPSQTVSTPKES